jgi:hypothetical protein
MGKAGITVLFLILAMFVIVELLYGTQGKKEGKRV